MATRQQPSSGERHQAAQSAITDSLGAVLLAKAWPEFDPARIKATLPRLSVLVAALVRSHGMASASQAITYYRGERAAAGISGRVTLAPARPPSVEQVQKELQWATSGLYGSVTHEKVQAAEAKVVGAAEKMALDVGRGTILDAVAKDQQAKGWARVPEPGACAFCAMLAARGAVYKKDSFEASNVKFAGGGYSFKVHDHCRCHIEPQFSRTYEPTAEVRQWQADWDRVTKGLSGADARLAWRQHHEGRDVTAKRGSSKANRSKSATPAHASSHDVDAGKSTAELQATLDKLEKSLAKFDSPGTRKRVEDLRRKIAARS